MRWWILAVLGIAQLMVILDNTIVNIALPTAQHDLGFSNADRQWIVTAYSLAFGSLLLLGGRIGDIIGRKRALIIGLVGFAVASAIGGAAVELPHAGHRPDRPGCLRRPAGPLGAGPVDHHLQRSRRARARRSASTAASPEPAAPSASCSAASSPRTPRGGGPSSSTWPSPPSPPWAPSCG